MKTVVVIGSGNVAEALAGAIAASPYGLAAIAPASASATFPLPMTTTVFMYAPPLGCRFLYP